jgi:ABC-type branched-subunit amino acid transport system ATPase component
MAALLEVKGLKAFYGQTQALYDIGFDIANGGITTLLGANGAGKTTTLRAICNMLRTEGTIRFDGQDIVGKATEEIVRLRIAHVPEGRGTFTTLTVEVNLSRSRSRLRLFPAPEGTAAAAGRHFIRWRAADAGDRSRRYAEAAPDVV